MMLAELELDEEFSSLGENEQKSWLESLFFMDTKHNPGRQPRDQLSKTKVQKKNTLRVNQDSATRLNPVEPKNREPVLEDPESAATAVHVNDKMKNLAQDFFKPKSSTTAAARKSSVSVERKTSIRTATPPEMPSPDLSRKDSPPPSLGLCWPPLPLPLASMSSVLRQFLRRRRRPGRLSPSPPSTPAPLSPSPRHRVSPSPPPSSPQRSSSFGQLALLGDSGKEKENV